jgi:hypothetical protein
MREVTNLRTLSKYFFLINDSCDEDWNDEYRWNRCPNGDAMYISVAPDTLDVEQIDMVHFGLPFVILLLQYHEM